MKRSGFVSITGQPNVGKSTLINAFLEEKVAIVSKKPETTRDNIHGIYTDKDTQIVFIDTPGIHRPHNLLGKLMVKKAESSIMEADVVLFVTERKTALNRTDMNIIAQLPHPESKKPVILVINKVDQIKPKEMLLPLLQKISHTYPFAEIVPISAIKKEDPLRLLNLIKKYIPKGPAYYPDDQLTDKTNEFMIQEIIREKVLECTYEEIPHSVAVVVDEFKFTEKNKVNEIYATIFVERLSQKSIIIGKGGLKMKEIGQKARIDIEELLGTKAYLNLWVKVLDKWKNDPNALERIGYTD